MRPGSRTRADGEDYPVERRRLLGRWLRKVGIELMLYPAPLPESFESGIPFVIAIHDLQHLLQPEFPEVSANGQYEIREYLFRNSARHATLIFADSEVGREDILTHYEEHGATEDRVKVLPFVGAPYLETVSNVEAAAVRREYDLPDRYLFYPANFWPHKNHVRIIEAIGELKAKHDIDTPIALTGASKDPLARSTLAKALAKASEYGIEDSVHQLGHVPDDRMASLYAGATALVMPTFFGPTNIPVLEAWASGCPVLTSDIRGIREQVGDAAILADPRSTEQIADGIRRLWTDAGLRDELVARGRERLSQYTSDDYRERLATYLDDAKRRVSATQLSR